LKKTGQLNKKYINILSINGLHRINFFFAVNVQPIPELHK